MNFLKYRYISFIISGFLVGLAVFSLARFGLVLSLDFTGGSLLEVKLGQEASSGDLWTAFEESKVAVSQIQETQEGSFLIRFENDKSQEGILAVLAENFGPVEKLRFETVSPTMGGELFTKALTALVVAVALILLYLSWRFKSYQFGIFAILAMLHDALILTGVFSLLGKTRGVAVDALFITALLTTLSSSVHDTVVTFDYIRKQTGRFFSADNLEEIANRALSQTIVRNINNSLTIIFMLTAALLLGGETIRWFVVALLVGTILGTYSSTFLAVPLLVSFEQWRRRRGKRPERTK